MQMHTAPFRSMTSEIDVNAVGVDLVLAQVLATARYITVSLDVMELEKAIATEFG